MTRCPLEKLQPFTFPQTIYKHIPFPNIAKPGYFSIQGTKHVPFVLFKIIGVIFFMKGILIFRFSLCRCVLLVLVGYPPQCLDIHCQFYLLDAYPTNSIEFLRILYKGHSLRHIYFKYFFSLFAVNFNYPFLIQVTLIQVTTVCVVSVFLMALVLGLEKHCP